MLQTLRPPELTFYEEMQGTLALIREIQGERERFLQLANLSALKSAAIAEAGRHLTDVAQQVGLRSQLALEMQRVHRSWYDATRPMKDVLEYVRASAALSLAESARRAFVAERFLAGVDFGRLRSALVLPDPFVTRFRSALDDFSESYRRLANSVVSVRDYVALPSFAIPSASREVFLTGRTLNVVAGAAEEDSASLPIVAEAEDEASSCTALLRRIDTQLGQAYAGAMDAVRSGSRDRARHVLVSLREVCTGLLNALAPESSVLEWIPERSDKYLHDDGKPKRIAQVEYICRGVNYGPLTAFAAQDVHVVEKLFRVFNRLHSPDPGLTDNDLRALLLRTESWIVFIIRIWEETMPE